MPYLNLLSHLQNTPYQIWSWWVAEMRDIGQHLSGHKRRLREAAVLRVLKDPTGSDHPLLQREGSIESGKTRKSANLVFDASTALKLTRSYPKAVEGNLDDLLAMELARDPILSAENLFWACHTRKNTELTVSLYLIKAGFVAAAEEQAQQQGCNLLSLLLETDEKNRLPLKSSAPADKSKQSLLPFRLLQVSICASLIILGVGLRQHQAAYDKALETINGEIVDLTREARLLREKLKEREVLEDKANFLTLHRATQISSVHLWNLLSKTLPDDTWLSALKISTQSVQMSGFTRSDAGGLIALLNELPEFQEVAFTAPLTTNPDTQAIRFEIKAQRALTREGRPK